MSVTQTGQQLPNSLPEICAPRTELLKRFDKAAERQYVYVQASGGYGKTISTLLWIRKTGRRPIWLTLDEYDNSPVLFYRLFCRSLLNMREHDEKAAQRIKSYEFAVSPVEYTLELLSQLLFDEGRYALVLDDFHHIVNEEILKSLPHVMNRLPATLTVLMLSRANLPNSFEDLCEKNKISFLGEADLAFTGEEIRKHFAHYGRYITSSEADAIQKYTEGWILALNAMAMSGNMKVTQKLSFDSFFEKNIWNRLDAGLQDFILKTSVVDSFTVELCQRLTEAADAKQTLDMLLCGNMYISLMGGSYRYHTLFGEFLAEKLRDSKIIDKQRLYRQAARYYLQTGNDLEAFRFFIQCGDQEGIIQSIHSYLRTDSLSSAEIFQLYFINKLPTDILDEYPFLYAVCVWCSFLFGNAADMLYYLERLYGSVHRMRGDESFLGLVIFSTFFDFRYTLPEQLARFSPESVVIRQDRPIPRTLANNMPFFHRAYRDYSYLALDEEAAYDEFERYYSMLLKDDLTYILSGLKAGILFEKNRLQESLAVLAGMPGTDAPELLFLKKVMRSSVLFALGREDEAAQERLAMERLLEKDALYLMPVYLAYQTRIELAKGNKTAARQWLSQYFVADVQDAQLQKIFLHFTTARTYILLGEQEKAQSLCAKLKCLAQDFHRPLDEAEADILTAVSRWAAGRKQEAAEALFTAVSRMKAYRFIRVFAEEGKALLPVVNLLMKKLEREEHADKNMIQYLNNIRLAVYEQAKQYKGIAPEIESKSVKLSPQQKRVLELMAKGCKNAEIVEITELSLNTIRTHTKIAYQKLKVNNTMDAVLRARELKLID